MDPVHAAIDSAARPSRARLLAFLAARAGGDVAAADALGDAFAAALVQWPSTGVPDKSEARLLTAARCSLIDGQRRGATRFHAMPALQQVPATTQPDVDADHDFPDERLKLLFVCAHPAIDPGTRTPLMLQTVPGLEGERIAFAFLTSPSAMGQHLVRAKQCQGEAPAARAPRKKPSARPAILP